MGAGAVKQSSGEGVGLLAVQREQIGTVENACFDDAAMASDPEDRPRSAAEFAREYPKIASRLTRTYTDRHGLKNLVEELLGENLSKQQQSSDWGGPVLSDAQRDYAASDVRYLHRLRDELTVRLEREGRTAIAQACFDFLPTRARLDLAGWSDRDIFSHE